MTTFNEHLRREPVEFESEGATLRGWIDLPPHNGPHPAVVVTGGFAGVKEIFLYQRYPHVFATAGFAVLVYDHINCGTSDGDPRQELDPVKQQRGYRDAITFLRSREDVDGDRIGIWGTSYSGGHVLAVAAADRRVRCVVSQAMTISGHGNLLRRYSPSGYEDLRGQWAVDRQARACGEPAQMMPAFASESVSTMYMQEIEPKYRAHWRNEITVRSLEMYDEYEPAAFIDRISPTPLLMIVASADNITPSEDALAAYNRALEPKSLVVVPGHHHSVYREQFDLTSGVARAWFAKHL